MTKFGFWENLKANVDMIKSGQPFLCFKETFFQGFSKAKITFLSLVTGGWLPALSKILFSAYYIAK